MREYLPSGWRIPCCQRRQDQASKVVSVRLTGGAFENLLLFFRNMKDVPGNFEKMLNLVSKEQQR